MISVELRPRRRLLRRRRMVLAVFSYRYDAHLVPALLANVEPMTDGWVAYDDRASTEFFSDEIARRFALLEAARAAGADWALAVDPDERFENRLAARIDSLTRRRGPVAYTFPLRELYSADEYRVDGVWGTKVQARLLSLRHGIVRTEGGLHGTWSDFVPGVRLRRTAFNLYHLKMIDPARRRARAALYRQLDPDRRMQPIGYDYLADDAGAILERIPRGRGYHPPHAEDGELWMPVPESETLS